jgi:outer membrane protein TolC
MKMPALKMFFISLLLSVLFINIIRIIPVHAGSVKNQSMQGIQGQILNHTKYTEYIKRIKYIKHIKQTKRIELSNIKNLKTDRRFTLKMAIKAALKNSDLIKSAVERIKAAEANLNSMTASMLPKLTFHYNASRMEYQPYLATPHMPIPVFDSSGTKDGYMFFPPRIYMNSVANFNWNAEITQPIFTGFALLDKKQLAALGINIARVYKKEAVLNIIESVKIAYFNVLRFQKQLKVAQEQVRSLKSHEMQAQEFYKQGIIPYNDLLKSEVALANALQYRVNSKASLNIAISNFNTILNENINGVKKFKNVKYINSDSAEAYRFSYKKLNNLTDYALLNRPGLKVFKFRIKQLTLKEKIADSRYYPQISAFAAYSQSGQNWLASSNEFSNQANKIIGLSATWTLFNWFKTSDNYQKQRHDKLALKYNLKSYINNVRLQIKSNLLELNAAYTNIGAAKLAVKQAKENLKITNLQYKQQVVTSTEVLDAETYLKRAKLNYYNSLYGYDIFLAKLERAIGRNTYGY